MQAAISSALATARRLAVTPSGGGQARSGGQPGGGTGGGRREGSIGPVKPRWGRPPAAQINRYNGGRVETGEGCER